MRILRQDEKNKEGTRVVLLLQTYVIETGIEVTEDEYERMVKHDKDLRHELADIANDQYEIAVKEGYLEHMDTTVTDAKTGEDELYNW